MTADIKKQNWKCVIKRVFFVSRAYSIFFAILYEVQGTLLTIVLAFTVFALTDFYGWAAWIP